MGALAALASGGPRSVFTLLGLLDRVSCVLAVLALRRWGRGWRDERVGRRLARQDV